MSRVIALEWDGREARIAVATLRGDQMELERAFAAPFPSEDPEPAARGEAIAEALRTRRIPKGKVIVAISRSSVELKRLSLPPAPDEELPDMVRFQAMRDFHSLGEDWALDFIPMAAAEGEPRVVLAAAIGPTLIADVRATCEAAGLELERLCLRPCPAASLFLRHRGEKGLSPEAKSAETGEPDKHVLLDLSGDEVDLTVLFGSELSVLRTTRSLIDTLATPEESRSLVAEIRRTLAAASQQLGGGRVEGITLCGAKTEHVELAKRIESDLSIPVGLFDPFEQVLPRGRSSFDMPEHPGRYAPLLGMLADEASGAHAIDFLNPRKPPEPVKQERPLLRIAALVGVLFLVCAGGVWWWFYTTNATIDHEREMAGKLKPKVAEANEQIALARELRSWENDAANWLVELDRLSKELPEAKEMRVTQLRLYDAKPSTSGQNPAIVNLDGNVRDNSSLTKLEANLRSDRHDVRGGDRQLLDKPEPPYSYSFKSEVLIWPPDHKKNTSNKSPKRSPSRQRS